MAVGTDDRLAVAEQAGERAGMRRVTGHAVAVGERFVFDFVLASRQQQSVVAVSTEFRPRLFKESAILAAVAIVTAGTTARLDRLVNYGLAKVALRVGVTLVAELVGTACQHRFAV